MGTDKPQGDNAELDEMIAKLAQFGLSGKHTITAQELRAMGIMVPLPQEAKHADAN